MNLPDRQQELVDTHRAVQDADLPHVLVGGWAVSAFQTRFTTDVDLVVPEQSLREYDALLRNRGYEKISDHEVGTVYEGRIVRYDKQVGTNEVHVDALVGAMRCRQTDAEWSYRYLHAHSALARLEVAPELEGRIPEPELLCALKLHSGRFADTRDLVIVSTRADLDRIPDHLHRGDPAKLETQIQGVVARLIHEGFEDSFKGVFEQRELPDDAIAELRSFLETQLADL